MARLEILVQKLRVQKRVGCECREVLRQPCIRRSNSPKCPFANSNRPQKQHGNRPKKIQ